VFAIARIQKLNSWGSVGGAGQHVRRERETPNADPERTGLNRQLLGDPSKDLVSAVRERIGNQKIRKNAVLAVEVFLGASPEYFRPGQGERAGEWEPVRLERWVEANTAWLQKTYGDRVVSAWLHLDESTAHIQAHLVPLDERGKLNCRALFGGSRDRLRRWQDEYAAAMAPQGLERGVPKSQAKHTAIRSFYGQLQQPVPEAIEVSLPPVQPLLDRLNPEGYRRRAEQALEEQLAEPVAILSAKSQDRDRAVTRAIEYRQTAQRAVGTAKDAERAAGEALETARAQARFELINERRVLREEREQLAKDRAEALSLSEQSRSQLKSFQERIKQAQQKAKEQAERDLSREIWTLQSQLTLEKQKTAKTQEQLKQLKAAAKQTENLAKQVEKLKSEKQAQTAELEEVREQLDGFLRHEEAQRRERQRGADLEL
jgi:DNA repair exonuclease SbcCD ATPase subunit